MTVQVADADKLTDGVAYTFERLQEIARTSERCRRVLFDFLTVVDDMTSAYRTGQNLNPPAPAPTVDQIMTRLREASREAHDAHIRTSAEGWTNR